MVNEWWLAAEGVLFILLLVWHGRMSYRHGIWDGAFNHFLPIVRREMIFYDERRAKLIFESEDETVEFCDCERSANGLGLSGRKCDCR